MKIFDKDSVFEESDQKNIPFMVWEFIKVVPLQAPYRRGQKVINGSKYHSIPHLNIGPFSSKKSVSSDSLKPFNHLPLNQLKS